MRGWTQVTEAQLRKRLPDATASKSASKYRNVKVEVDGLRFDSKREALYWLDLKAREAAGEIRDVRRQVVFGLFAPVHDKPGMTAMVSSYIADYTYVVVATGSPVVVDVKGVRTRLYLLKKKWLAIQSGIVIEEV
jgi:hypothetical protein